MKKVLFSILGVFLLYYPSAIKAQTVRVEAEVYETVELMSIMMMLTGGFEYNQESVWQEYKEIVNVYFSPYKDHSAIQFLKEYRKRRLSFGTPMSIAVNSSIIDGEIIIDWTEDSYGLNWDAETRKKFSNEINTFYKDTKFDGFFNARKELYDPVIEIFNKGYITRLNLKWLNDFFGNQGTREYRMALSYLNGPCNYGPAIVKDGEFIPIPITGIDDREKFLKAGQEFVQSTLATAFHEYLHPYCNPLIYQFYGKFEASGEVILPGIRKAMAKAGYSNWDTVLCESFVRASVIAYMKGDGFFADYLDTEITEQKGKGFYWVPKLADLLAEYENNRDTYPTIESFMPRMVDFYNQLAEDIKNEKIIVISL